MTYSQPMETYVSARGRSIAITVLTIVQLVFMALATAGWALGASGLGGEMSGAAAFVGLAAGLDGFEQLLFLSAIIVFLTWVYRSIANLPALGSMSCRFTPSGAVWCWFIPFVNLVRGHQVMATIWQESQPPVINENGFHVPRSPAIVHWWWGLWLVHDIPAIFARNFHHSGLTDLSSYSSWQVVSHFLNLACATLFLIMVRRAQSRQDEQWLDLERRRNVPQPSADALR